MPPAPTAIKDIFLSALESDTPTERAAYLDEACGGDAEVRRRVETLLQAHERPNRLLDQSAALLLAPEETTESLDFLGPSTQPGSLGRLGHYEVLEVLGRGGMGIVLRAFDDKLRRVVAIKVLASHLASNGSARQRFVREARAAAAVTHANVIVIHGVEDVGPVPYLVMQCITGKTLQEKIDASGVLGLSEILRIGLQIAEGLAAAHKQGLIHRDIKPANILLENGIERVKITDFGLARTVDDTSLTQSGFIAGTPLYMSPEQARGEPVDYRSDLFSLGCVLFAMCTGHSPFRASNSLAVLKRVCEDTPRPIRETNPTIPAWLETSIARLLAKDPASRFASASEVATVLTERLARLQSGLDSTETQPVIRTSVKRVRRRWLAAGAVLIAAVVALAGVASMWQPGDTQPQPPEQTPPSDTYTNGLGMAFVRVPKGTAWLGGGQGRLGDREVQFPSDFYLGTHEVTQSQWQKLMGDNPSGFSRTGVDKELVKDVADENLQRFPVDSVSWDDAQRFLDKLNQSDKVAGWVYRLPTVAEWEYACRGGPMADRAASAFSFYLDPPANIIQPTQANFQHDKALGRPREIGAYRPNRLGLHDMYGNIYEWTADAGRAPEHAVGRILRGGAYWMAAGQLNSGVVLSQQGKFHDVGFRVARVPVSEADPRRGDQAAWRKEVAALPAEEQATAVIGLLRTRNPACYDTVSFKVVAGAVTELAFLTDNVTDLEPVRALTGLRVLRCGGGGGSRGQLENLAPLTGLSLTHLDCRESLVSDLTPLVGMPLQELNCEATRVKDLTPLKDMKQLTVLKCRGSRVTELEPLRGLPLRVLTCDFRPERDTAVLRAMPTLVTINDKPAATFWAEVGPQKP